MTEITPATDLSAEHEEARLALRERLLMIDDAEMKDLYYKAVTLAEHEAARRAMITLASAMQKVWPHWTAQLQDYWAQRSAAADDALDRFLTFLRQPPADHDPCYGPTVNKPEQRRP